MEAAFAKVALKYVKEAKRERKKSSAAGNDVVKRLREGRIKPFEGEKRYAG